jgi:hypothetical protein
MRTVLLALITLIVLTGCTEKDEIKKQGAEKSMKCGAGKCGANMFDGNTALVKKKKNILAQMQEQDNRKECVIKAETTKSVYDCVRDPVTGKLSMTDTKQEASKKCGAQKCGGKM